MNIVHLILDACSDEEKELIAPSLANLYPSRDNPSLNLSPCTRKLAVEKDFNATPLRKAVDKAGIVPTSGTAGNAPTDDSPRNPFLACIAQAEENENRHYERLADARKRFFALHPERDDGREIEYKKGWWDANGFGDVHFQDMPEYRFRGQDLDVSADLIAKDRRYERKVALAKRQATWNRVQRSMRSDWKGSLTRGLKSG